MLTLGQAVRSVAITAVLAASASVPVHSPEAHAQAQSERPAAGLPGRFPNVVGALKQAPGCLGVELAQTPDGRRMIFAWFDGKQSLVDWYYSEAHQAAMKAVFPGQGRDREPLPDLASDVGPVLAIVSVKFAAPPGAPGGEQAPGAIASIGIELYGPLPGGVVAGGRFAPAAVRVPGLREFDIRTALPR
jgi:hypothetical protein